MTDGRILAVDDDPVNVEIYRELLEEHFALATAASGEEAVEVAQRREPDVVLLDIMMPGIDGYETCRRLRAHDRLRFSKVILVSARGTAAERVAGYEAGADDYVVKPFAPDELVAKVRVFLRLKSVEQVCDLKTESLRLLSHETRTPLNAIVAPAEMLMSSEPMEIEERRMWGRTILEGATRLQRLVEQALLLSQLRSGTLERSTRPCDLVAVVRRVLEELADVAGEAGVRVPLSAPEALPVPGSREQLAIVARTLIENAIQFSPEGAPVEVCLSGSGGRACLSVTDQGPGLAPERLERLFEPFGGRDPDHREGVQGLSLPLAHALARNHGGDLDVTSEPGRCTRFRLFLPAAVPEAHDARR